MLSGLVAEMPPFDFLAVTMTGELCDCFETKRQGVETILAAVDKVAGQAPVRVWSNKGRFIDRCAASDDPLSVAAANWLALAAFAGRFAPKGPALVMDVGSTTTDLVPLHDGKPVPRGCNDVERLRCRELVYTGATRTPLCALLGPKGAAEFFATTLDVYLVLGDLPEDNAKRDTADGRPATRAYAHSRLARMICADRETCTAEATHELACQIRDRQVRLLRRAVRYVAASLAAPPATVILAGSGEFLAEKVLPPDPSISRVSLAEKLGPMRSRVSCAYALAVLAAERTEDGE